VKAIAFKAMPKLPVLFDRFHLCVYARIGCLACDTNPMRHARQAPETKKPLAWVTLVVMPSPP
jgi:hypothetical protein